MRHATAAAAALLLAACGGQGGNESGDAKGGGAVALQPGEWETTIQFTELDVPGMPPEMTNQMRQMMGQPQSNRACMTPEEAANPAGDIVGGENNRNCDYSESTFAGGTIRVRGTCRDPGGGTSQMALEGSYTATSMQARITTEQQGGAGAPAGQSMRMSGNLAARRVGDCPAGGATGG